MHTGNYRTRIITTIVIVLVSSQFFSGCTAGYSIRKEISETPRHITLIIESGAIAANKIGDTTLPTLSVYLPASYESSQKKYPVLYFLPGYSEPESTLYRTFRSQFDDAAAANDGKEFILVGVTGMNRFGGAFYVDSPATGNWESFVVRETVGLIDKRFRTLPATTSRGLFGFSMGGFGAINLGFRHPDIFSCVFAIGPGLFDAHGLANAMPTWSFGNFKKAYGLTFAPDMTTFPPSPRIPALDGSPSDNAIVALWEEGFGNLEKKIAAYLEGKARLRALRIEYGQNESYPWIADGCRYFADLLEKKSVPFEIGTFDGGHSILPATVTGSVIPFFSAHLEFGP